MSFVDTVLTPLNILWAVLAPLGIFWHFCVPFFVIFLLLFFVFFLGGFEPFFVLVSTFSAKSHISHVICNIFSVKYHLWTVTCLLSPFTTPTATATDPSSANSPINTVGWFPKTQTPKNVWKKRKINQNKKKLKLCDGRPMLAIRLRPEVSSPLGSGFSRQTDTETYIPDSRLNRPRGRFS